MFPLSFFSFFSTALLFFDGCSGLALGPSLSGFTTGDGFANSDNKFGITWRRGFATSKAAAFIISMCLNVAFGTLAPAEVLTTSEEDFTIPEIVFIVPDEGFSTLVPKEGLGVPEEGFNAVGDGFNALEQVEEDGELLGGLCLGSKVLIPPVRTIGAGASISSKESNLVRELIWGLKRWLNEMVSDGLWLEEVEEDGGVDFEELLPWW